MPLYLFLWKLWPFSSLLPDCSFLPSLLSQIAFPCHSPSFASLQQESTAGGSLLHSLVSGREGETERKACSISSAAS